MQTLVEQVTENENIDGYLPINGNQALQCAKDLASKEGIFVGISAGATFAGALQIADRHLKAPTFYACSLIPENDIFQRHCLRILVLK
ncbi:MAG: hypothetical protein OEZ47_05540 [Gammaproteobacteria bacterium]|nr:hypothetical protein [Gammaproteobacteria bacterium]